MAMIDMTHRKLRFPPRFIPYLERHRIFELFHECVELLVQVKPKDHILFLKNILPCAAMRKDKSGTMRLGGWQHKPFDLDLHGVSIEKGDICAPYNYVTYSHRETFSELLAECLGIRVFNVMNLETLTRDKQMEEVIKIQAMSESETLEDESCICPEESAGSPQSPFYFAPSSETGFLYGPSETELGVMDEQEQFELGGSTERSAEEECKDGKTDKGEPCICVCPCKKKAEEEATGGGFKEGGERVRKADSDVKQEKEDGVGKGDLEERQDAEEAGENGQAWDYYPCPPVGDKKKKHKDEKMEGSPFWTSPVVSTSMIEIDFGILKECEISAQGWILEDFPVSGIEAERLNTMGVIPTHALRIIMDEEEENKNRNYKMVLKDWMKAYNYVPVMEIRVNGRSVPELVRDMCSLLSLMPHRHAPMLPRIVLIGSRGSGVTTQAEKLALKYGMVHVDFEVVKTRALDEDDELCKLYKVQLATRPDPELEAVILERALLTKACLNRGWVLTGYPKDVDQMRMLDIVATPPNRVIFIEVPARECFVRLYYRKIDPCLGDEYKLPLIEPEGCDSYKAPSLDPEIVSRLVSHPRNNRKQIIKDIEEYFLYKHDIMAYCGKNASYVNGDQEVDRVFEQIEHVIINPAPPQPPRDPLSIHHGIEESYERLKKFRLARGMFFNNLLLNPPENANCS